MKKDPSQTFVRTETVENSRVVRVAIADRMVNDTCVNCHNSRTDSPKTDSRLGDVRGVLEVTIGIDAQLAMNRRMLTMVGIICATALFLVGGFFILFIRSLVKPIRVVMQRLYESAAKTAPASDEVSNAAQSLASGSTEQAATLKDTSSTMKRIAGMVQSNRASMEAAVAEMKLASQSTEVSNRSWEEMSRSTGSMRHSTAEMSKVSARSTMLRFRPTYWL
jgi:hypothetical protein